MKLTEQEIIKSNKLIAEFMDVNHYHSNGYENYVYSDNNHRTEIDLNYHSSWDWLMPVVENIWNVIGSKNLFFFDIPKKLSKTKDFTIYSNITTNNPKTIEIVYSIVIQYIEWYNKQK